MLDCLLIIVPKISIMRPLVGPPLLKAHILENGFTAKVVDYNIKLYNELAKFEEEAAEIWAPRYHRVKTDHLYVDAEDDKKKLMREGSPLPKSPSTEIFGSESDYESFYEDTLKPYVQRYAQECIDENARWIGISLLTKDSVWATGSFVKEIKAINPDQKIVLGGPGAEIYKHKSHLVKPDEIILGEGDEPIVSLLKGEPILDQFYHLPNLKNVPYPDYSDLDFNEYVSSESISITGSRGCVRNCTFCTVRALWPKFTYRPGKDIAGEMIHLNKEYGITHFEFTDSLINGSIKALNDICTEFKQVKKEQNIIPWTWTGNAICKSAKQMPEEIWANMQDTGISFLRIGIESGSESVRNHMRKMNTNEDIRFTFEMATKYNIPIAFNMIVGYPTETEEDFQDSITLFKYIAELNKSIPDQFKHLACGLFTCKIIDGSPLEDIQDVAIQWVTNDKISIVNPAVSAGSAMKDIKAKTLTNLHWEIKDHPEGLPYNAAIRLDRMDSLTKIGLDLELIIPNDVADGRHMPRYLSA